MTIGEANRRSIQNQPRNEFPWPTAGMSRIPRANWRGKAEAQKNLGISRVRRLRFSDDQDKKKRRYQEKAADEESQEQVAECIHGAGRYSRRRDE